MVSHPLCSKARPWSGNPSGHSWPEPHTGQQQVAPPCSAPWERCEPAPCEPIGANPQPDGAACPACTRGDPNWHPLHSGMLPPCGIPAGAAGTGSIPPGRLSQTTALRAIQGQLDPSLWDTGRDPMWTSHVQTRGTFMTPLPVPRCTHQGGMHHPALCRQASRSYISVLRQNMN